MTETTVGEGKEHRTVDSKQTDTDDRFMGTWHSKCPPPKKNAKKTLIVKQSNGFVLYNFASLLEQECRLSPPK